MGAARGRHLRSRRRAAAPLCARPARCAATRRGSPPTGPLRPRIHGAHRQGDPRRMPRKTKARRDGDAACTHAARCCSCGGVHAHVSACACSFHTPQRRAPSRHILAPRAIPLEDCAWRSTGGARARAAPGHARRHVAARDATNDVTCCIANTSRTPSRAHGLACCHVAPTLFCARACEVATLFFAIEQRRGPGWAAGLSSSVTLHAGQPQGEPGNCTKQTGTRSR